VRNRQANPGEGTVWLREDSARHDFVCAWYIGTSDGHLAEQARVATSDAALAWGQARTPRVRIHTGAQSYWAGAAPRPEGFTRTWSE
jgi:hypothetical protein